uniref:Uncharacterized protein n=1 Tax=Anguilla anguilla TaxID=7936 RepID=A0A0E9W1P2_ANGAN
MNFYFYFYKTAFTADKCYFCCKYVGWGCIVCKNACSTAIQPPKQIQRDLG